MKTRQFFLEKGSHTKYHISLVETFRESEKEKERERERESS